MQLKCGCSTGKDRYMQDVRHNSSKELPASPHPTPQNLNRDPLKGRQNLNNPLPQFLKVILSPPEYNEIFRVFFNQGLGREMREGGDEFLGSSLN